MDEVYYTIEINYTWQCPNCKAYHEYIEDPEKWGEIVCLSCEEVYKPILKE